MPPARSPRSAPAVTRITPRAGVDTPGWRRAYCPLARSRPVPPPSVTARVPPRQAVLVPSTTDTPEGATLHPMNLSWRSKAACLGLEPLIFFPETEEEAESAKVVCAECPVQEACLEYALVRREKEGVWGGCTERERRRIIRQRRRSA